MRNLLGFGLLGVAAVVAGSACGGKAKGETGKPTTGIGASGADPGGDLQIPKVDATLCDTAGKEVSTFDLNRDNRPDVWKLFQKMEQRGTQVTLLTCKQVDLNFDGKKDLVVHYDETGAILVEEYDFDFDGKLDARFHYDKVSGKRYLVERDTGFDNQPDIWEKYDKNEAPESIRRDRNGDAKPDYWEQYRAGRLDAILYDDDYDGKVDRQEQAKPSAPAAPTPSTSPAPDAAEPPVPAAEPASPPNG